MPTKHAACASLIFLLASSSSARFEEVGRDNHQVEALVGLWGSETIIAPTVRGELLIDARQGTWRAMIAGFRADVQRTEDRITFTLPRDAGEFRGRMNSESKKILGHWIQPRTIHPYGQRYASPVVLSEASANIWTGTVTPLEPRISFYLWIQRANDGSVNAFIRNPEANFFAGRTYRVEQNDERLSLAHPDVPEPVRYQAGRLFIPLIYQYPELIFTRHEGNDAVGFFPRVQPESGRYTYREPLPQDEGWATATLAEVGLDVRPLQDFVQRILTATPSPDNPVNIHSLLIARHGKLVLEEYFYGFDGIRTHDMRSASKTIAPVLVGIARDRGVGIGPETLLYSLFPEYKEFSNWDQRKNKITVEDAMNMASGLAIDDADSSSPGQEARLLSQPKQQDLYKYTLDLPMVRDPGGNHPIYGSANTNLVGGAVRNATGRWIPELFDEYLARPLQISTYHMNLMHSGEAYTGGGLYMRPRDQLKLGQLYLASGVWNGRRVVSKEWVERSVVRYGDMTPRMDIDVEHGYGYGWHFRDCKIDGKVYHYYWAGGNGGQLIIVIPELDMVVGFTGGDYTEFRKYLKWEIEMLPRFILPSALH